MDNGHVLAVGEPCAGGYEGGLFWCPRCKAKHPQDCITETALQSDLTISLRDVIAFIVERGLGAEYVQWQRERDVDEIRRPT